MKSGSAFELVYAPIVSGHLKSIERKYYPLIRTEIEMHLRFEPDRETKNRKPLKRPVVLGSKWEIRFGPGNRFRVFYTVDRPSRHVEILAIGQKRKSSLFIGREEIQT